MKDLDKLFAVQMALVALILANFVAFLAGRIGTGLVLFLDGSSLVIMLCLDILGEEWKKMEKEAEERARRKGIKSLF